MSFRLALDAAMPCPHAIVDRVSHSCLLRALTCGLLLVSACSVIFEGENAELHDGDADPDKQDRVQDASPLECTNTNLTISSLADDGEIYDSQFLPDGEFNNGKEQGILIGAWLGLSVWGYYRFLLPEDIVFSDIQSAYLGLWGRDVIDWNASSDALRVHLENVSDSVPVVRANQSPSNPAGQPLVSTAVRWPSAGGLDWQDDMYNVSTDVKDLLLSLDDQSAIPSGGRHITFWLRGDFTSGERAVISDDLALYAEHPTRLQIRTCP